MHFGKIVKQVALGQGLAAQDVANLLGRTEKEVLELYEQEEWISGTIRSASINIRSRRNCFLKSSILDMIVSSSLMVKSA